MATILKGAEVTAALNERLRRQAEQLRARGVMPALAILRVGEREDDISYEKSAAKRCESIGVAARHIVLPAGVEQQTLLDTIREVNEDEQLHGCLLLRPLPPHLDERLIRNALAAAKDVDGITDGSLAAVFTGSGKGYPPCTAQAVLEILDHFGVELMGKRVTLIGRSLVVGKPLAMLLLARHATVTICHTRSADIAARCREAEILIAAAGAAEMVKADFVAAGQVVVDVGVNFDQQGKLIGDVEFAAVEPLVAALTPVPGGVGTVTTSVLVKHTLSAAAQAAVI
ncbi:MAG: tetrahydrofolate dehydrogenase/cyclohydrolase catalytic domain-containing protein [Bacillota bacterium]|nr:tetrahydrofolate dehydrogenase/cyclohydrolase catalytic domain-containing protein [Bacillota bacterium]